MSLACLADLCRAAAGLPSTLVRKPSSTGGSKETSPAQCTIESRSVGSGGSVVQVALEHGDLGGHQRLDAPGGLDDVGEDRLPEQGRRPRGATGRAPLPRTSTVSRTPGHLGEHQLQQRLTDEARDARQEDVLVVELVGH